MGKITGFGLAVKKALLERGITQRDFCARYNIPENRFCEMLYGVRPAYKYKALVQSLLEIEEADQEGGRQFVQPASSKKSMR